MPAPNPSVRYGDTARIEIVSLESPTPVDEQFLLGNKGVNLARIGAELRLPPGAGRVPAVVLIHGSGGIGTNVHRWAQEFNGIGIAALIVDSFTGRGITQTITDQTLVSSFALIVDAYKSLEFLSAHPRILRERIAVMGFSKGGFAALYAGMRRFQAMWCVPGIEFDAYIPFYVRCDAPMLEDENFSERPIRLYHGSADDYVPVAPTRRYVERLKRAGSDVELTVYEGARHSFDNPAYPSVLPLPEGIVCNDCPREEKVRGTILNLETGKPFSWGDTCVKRGASVGYDSAATESAIQSVKEFLRARWLVNS